MSLNFTTNTCFRFAENEVLKNAVTLAISCEEPEVVNVFKEVKKDYIEPIDLAFSATIPQDAQWKYYYRSILIHSKFEEKCRKDYEYVYYVAILIIFEMVNAINKEQFDLGRISGFGRREYVFFREISEWSGTLLRVMHISKKLVLNHGWPSICLHRYSLDSNIHYLWQEINGHINCYADFWDSLYPQVPKVSVSAFPRPLSPAQKKILIQILNLRILASDDFDLYQKNRALLQLDRYEKKLAEVKFPCPRSWGITTEDEFNNFITNAQYVFSDLKDLEKGLASISDKH